MYLHYHTCEQYFVYTWYFYLVVHLYSRFNAEIYNANIIDYKHHVLELSYYTNLDNNIMNISYEPVLLTLCPVFLFENDVIS